MINFEDFNIPDDLKRDLEELLKSSLSSEVEDDQKFFNEITALFHEKYKTPSKVYRQIQKLAFFSCFMMMKSAHDDSKNESTSLYLLSLLTPMSMMYESC